MTDLSLSAEQLDRYSRHIIMDDVGPEGQKKLLDANVLCIGAGGLGSPIIQYLAAAGVGALGIADDDVVERSNLQRQVVHGDPDVGRPKVESARDFVERQNPDVEVRTHETRVTQDNVEDLLERYDVVVDGSDNFATRYLVNDACTLAGVPFAHGAILRFEGQVTTFEAGGTPGASREDGDRERRSPSGNRPEAGDSEAQGASGRSSGRRGGETASNGTAPPSRGPREEAADRGPCYRCLFPEAPEPGTVPDCATAGVLGVLPGTVGCIQATEVVKLVLGYGETLDGRMIFYDAADMTFEEIRVEQRPDCPVCTEGGVESIHDVEYESTCAI